VPESSQLTEVVLGEIFKILCALIPTHWKVIQVRKGFLALSISRNNENIAVQRVVYASYEGSIDIFVHRKEILGEVRDIMKDVVSASHPWFCEGFC